MQERLAKSGARWMIPRGGFFVVLTLPFRADDALPERSAADFGVLWTPMHHFYQGAGGNALRLSCSGVSQDHIRIGVTRLADLICQVVEETRARSEAEVVDRHR